MSSMQGKTVVITGASAGIGEELAVALASRGANLVLAARGEEALVQVQKRCEQAGGRAITVATDVTEPEACRRMVERAVEAFGGIDVLVNNAGISQWARFEDVKPGEQTVCVVPIPGDLNDPATLQRLQEESDDLPIYCHTKTIPPSPAQQEITIPLAN